MREPRPKDSRNILAGPAAISAVTYPDHESIGLFCVSISGSRVPHWLENYRGNIAPRHQAQTSECPRFIQHLQDFEHREGSNGYHRFDA